MTRITAGSDDPGSVYQRLDERLKTTAVRAVPGPLSADGRRVPFHVALDLSGLGTYEYDSTLELGESRDRWRVVFRSATVHPMLRNGQRLDRESQPAPRGTLLDRTGRPLRAASADLAANVLGRPPSKADPVGTGLERLLDARLTGSTGGALLIRDVVTGNQVQQLKVFPGRAADSVRTTLDLRVQAAAERALAGAPARAALVAIDAPTGEIRAIANNPVTGVTAAFASYAPGSVFKIVTATAALQAGSSPSTQLDCPASTSSGGRTFRNDENEAYGRIPLSTAFALSCNTAFLELAEGLPAGALQRTARLFGFARPDLLPIRAEGGEVPEPASAAEAAADAIGQGPVEASPLLVASMSAAVATGTWRQPHLLPGGAVASNPVPAAATLRTLMRGVVTRGTGRAADLPGVPVSGKTGTAQFGSGDPLPVHTWFTGFRGDLAFCVFVERGVSGGKTSAPIARRFLAAATG
ncbi:MAG: penicillin-binding protein [Actinobacteria bacterium]|nr:penicillin-binding protein [Actinomycetota bacterium]